MKPRVPAILVAAFALDALFSIANIVIQLLGYSGPDWEHVDRWRLAKNGAWFMTLLMMVVGYRDLADRVWGGANRMAKLASALCIALLVTDVVVMPISTLDLISSQTFWKVQNYVFWGELGAIAVVLFAGGDRKGLAVAGLALALVARLPPVVMEPVWDALHLGYSGAVALRSVLSIAYQAGVFMLVVAIVAGTPAHLPQRAVLGLRRAAGGFTLRIVAAIGGMLFVLLAAGASSDTAYSLIKLVLIGGLLVNMIASAMIGLGALAASRASLDGLAKSVLIVSAAGSLWCAGTMFEQLPPFYQMLYGHSHGKDALEALSLALPIVSALATAILGTAIGGLGRTRGDAALARAGTTSGVVYLGLTLAAIAMQSYMIEKVHSRQGAIGLLLAAAAAGLAAQIIMGKLCRRAADAIEAEPGLAPARVNG